MKLISIPNGNRNEGKNLSKQKMTVKRIKEQKRKKKKKKKSETKQNYGDFQSVSILYRHKIVMYPTSIVSINI